MAKYISDLRRPSARCIHDDVRVHSVAGAENEPMFVGGFMSYYLGLDDSAASLAEKVRPD